MALEPSKTSSVRILHAQEMPDPNQPLGMEPTSPAPSMTIPPMPTPMMQGQTKPGINPQVLQVVGLVLASRLQSLLLLLSAMAVGWMVCDDPQPLRLYAGAGYGLFVLAGLSLINKVR